MPAGTGVDQNTALRPCTLVVATTASADALSGFESEMLKLGGVPVQFHHDEPPLEVCCTASHTFCTPDTLKPPASIAVPCSAATAPVLVALTGKLTVTVGRVTSY